MKTFTQTKIASKLAEYRDIRRKLMEADKASCQDNKGSLSGWEFSKLKPTIQECRMLKWFHPKHIRVRQKWPEGKTVIRSKNENQPV